MPALLPDRTHQITVVLAATYPDAHCELDFQNPLQLLIATILAAQCTDKRVNMVTPALFARCPDAKTFAEISQEELEELVKSTGFYRNKATAIRAAASEIVERHGGEVPETVEALTALSGVGRKTANMVLGSAMGKNEGIVVDTHVVRLSRLLGLTSQKDPVKIEKELMELVPRDQWTLWGHQVTFHGRRRCFAKKPDCAACEIRELCPVDK